MESPISVIITAILQILIIFIVPYIILLNNNKGIVKIFGSIGIAYFVGLLISLIRFVFSKNGIVIPISKDIGEIGSHVAIAIAIPLLLFSCNLSSIKQLSKKVLVSFGLLIISVVVSAVIVNFAMKPILDNSNYFAGMSVGLYTGGTPNLNAIGSILRLDNSYIGLANLSDMVIGAFLLFFLLFAYRPLTKKILNFNHEKYVKSQVDVANVDNIEINSIDGKKLFINFIIAFACVLAGALLGLIIWIVNGSPQGHMIDFLVPILLITVTILGIALSFNKTVREVKGSNVLGHYLILVFSLALAMSFDFNQFNPKMSYIFWFFAFVTIGTLIIHTVLCKIFKIDQNCAIVTLTAGVYGPAFIPAITRQTGNDNLTAAGLICGSIGYAIGTFIGLLVAYIL